MNELAIKAIQVNIDWLKTKFQDETTKSKINQYEQAIAILKNPPMWTDEDMKNCFDADHTEYWYNGKKGDGFNEWIEDYRKQKESKNG